MNHATVHQGAGGSAVFSLNSSKYYFGYIVGIHVRGGTTANEASRIDRLAKDREAAQSFVDADRIRVIKGGARGV